VGHEASQDLVEAFHREREQGVACPLGVLVDNDPCGLADLPERLAADDLVCRSAEEHREPLECSSSVSH
jgi:hypothetical protein